MEILLFIIIILEGVYIAYLEYQFKKERSDLLKAILAKNLTDYTSNAIIEKEQPKIKEEPPDLIPIEEADDKLFNKAIRQ